MQDVGRTREELVAAGELFTIFRVFFQHPTWFIMPLNHRKLWSIAFI